MSDPCERVGTEYGDDTWQPMCDLDAGHDGPCDWDPNRERWEREKAGGGVCVICGAKTGSNWMKWCSEEHRHERHEWRVNTLLRERWELRGNRPDSPFHRNVHYGLSIFDEAIAVEQARPVPSRLAWRPWRQKL